MTVDLAGKVFIVTSSASGMGHATARTPAPAGSSPHTMRHQRPRPRKGRKRVES